MSPNPSQDRNRDLKAPVPRFTWRKYNGYAGWIMAILLSGLLNITLFGLMPGLIQRIPQRPDTLDVRKVAHVVRISSEQKAPPEKKDLKKSEPKPVQPRKKVPPKVVKVPSPQPKPMKTKLPFKLNPVLPKISKSLVMPPLEHFTMEIDAPAVVEAPAIPSPPTTTTPESPAQETQNVSSAAPEMPPLKDQYGMGELDSPLTPLVKIPPMYPMRAKRRGIEGWVRIRFQVDRRGRVNLPEVLEADPEKVFDSSVIKCVEQWRFKPGTVQGRAVNTLVETTIRFELE